MEKKIHAQPPKTLTGIQLTAIPTSAVGVKAITSAMSHIKKEVGLVKGIVLLKNINQKMALIVLDVHGQIQMLNVLF